MLATGSTLEGCPHYIKSTCFEAFPFPTAAPEQQNRLCDLAKQLDAHRKRQQVQHPTLALSGMYNVLNKIRSGEPLTAKDKAIHEQGLVSVLQTLHDELDAAVLENPTGQPHHWQGPLEKTPSRPPANPGRLRPRPAGW